MAKMDYGSMYPLTHVEGFEDLMKYINKEIGAIKGRTTLGLIKAASVVRHETENGSIRTPVDTGNLRSSWFVVTNTGVPVGGSPTFYGEKSAIMAADHQAAITEAKKEAMGYGGNPVVICGYSANYAVYVHEKMDPKVRWKRRGSGPKWLQAAFEKHRNNIVKIVGMNQKMKA